MENQINQSISNAVPANVQQPRTNNFLVALLSVLLFISVSISGFFAFQNQKLVIELKEIRNIEKIAAEATIKPTSSVDQTADWKIYSNNEYGFLFKYPTNWKIQTGFPNSGLISLLNEENRFFVTFHESYTVSEWLDESQSGKIIGKKKIGGYTFTVIQGGLLQESLEYALDIKGSGFVRFVLESANKTAEAEDIFDQILSTFKFTN